MILFRKSYAGKIYQLKSKQLSRTQDIYRKIILSLQKVNNSLQNKKRSEIIIYTQRMLGEIDLLQKSITTQMKLEIFPLFDKPEANYTISKKVMRDKTDYVINWLNDIKTLILKFQKSVRVQRNNLNDLIGGYLELHDTILLERTMTDFENTWRFLLVEEVAYNTKNPPDYFNILYESCKFHPIIEKSSKRLFVSKHYTNSITDAYKALANYVKKKSGIKNLTEFKLMSNVLSFDFDKETQKIARLPKLQLNNLKTITDRNKQDGLRFLLMGAMKLIRNPQAHDNIELSDPYLTLKYLSFASLLATKMDECKKNK